MLVSKELNNYYIIGCYRLPDAIVKLSALERLDLSNNDLPRFIYPF